MKTSEFVEKVNSLGFDVVISDLDVFVVNSTGSNILVLLKDNQFVLNTDWRFFELLKDELQAELFGIAVEYASTKPEERE